MILTLIADLAGVCSFVFAFLIVLHVCVLACLCFELMHQRQACSFQDSCFWFLPVKTLFLTFTAVGVLISLLMKTVLAESKTVETLLCVSMPYFAVLPAGWKKSD